VLAWKRGKSSYSHLATGNRKDGEYEVAFANPPNGREDGRGGVWRKVSLTIGEWWVGVGGVGEETHE